MVVDDRHNDDDNNGNHDTGTLLEAVCPAVLSDAEHYRDDCCHYQYFQNKVVEDFFDHCTDSANLTLMSLVLPKSIQHKYELLSQNAKTRKKDYLHGSSHCQVPMAAIDAGLPVRFERPDDSLGVLVALEEAERPG